MERPFTGIDYDELALYLDENYSKVSSSTLIRSLESYGFGDAFSAEIWFAPHDTTNEVESFYSLSCHHAPDDGFTCGDLDTLHSIAFSDPDDYVRITDELPAEVARKIITSVRESILADASGTYEFEEWGEKKTSDRPLDLLRIETVSPGHFNVYADSDASCTFHLIEVRESDCGLEQCSFEIVKNEVVHFV